MPLGTLSSFVKASSFRLIDTLVPSGLIKVVSMLTRNSKLTSQNVVLSMKLPPLIPRNPMAQQNAITKLSHVWFDLLSTMYLPLCGLKPSTGLPMSKTDLRTLLLMERPHLKLFSISNQPSLNSIHSSLSASFIFLSKNNWLDQS